MRHGRSIGHIFSAVVLSCICVLGVTDQGGTITLSAGSLSMQNSAISTISTGTQNGGNIVIAAQDSVNASAGSTISASNTGTANAGNITVNAGNQFAMTN